jgi:hypothetical protein
MSTLSNVVQFHATNQQEEAMEQETDRLAATEQAMDRQTAMEQPPAIEPRHGPALSITVSIFNLIKYCKNGIL